MLECRPAARNSEGCVILTEIPNTDVVDRQFDFGRELYPEEQCRPADLFMKGLYDETKMQR